MKKILTWFSSIEQSIFGDKIESNDYFATISIMFAAFTGALLGGGDFLYNWDIINSRLDSTATFSFLVILASMNIAESIMAAKTAGAGIGRSLILLVAIPLAAAVGYAVAVIVFVIILLWIILLAFSIALSGGGSKSGSGGSSWGSGGDEDVSAYDENGSPTHLEHYTGDLYRERGTGDLYRKDGNRFSSERDGKELNRF